MLNANKINLTKIAQNCAKLTLAAILVGGLISGCSSRRTAPKVAVEQACDIPIIHYTIGTTSTGDNNTLGIENYRVQNLVSSALEKTGCFVKEESEKSWQLDIIHGSANNQPKRGTENFTQTIIEVQIAFTDQQTNQMHAFTGKSNIQIENKRSRLNIAEYQRLLKTDISQLLLNASMAAAEEASNYFIAQYNANMNQ